MTKKIDFYFDFISPYSFLAHKKIINSSDRNKFNELKHLTNNAFQNDIFGAPTFVINDNLFWGQDRLEYALDELNN